jgi:Tol biopolymer transport system component
MQRMTDDNIDAQLRRFLTAEAELRAEDAASENEMFDRVQLRVNGRRLNRGMMVLLAAALLVTALVAGTILAGSFRKDASVLVSSPSPSASLRPPPGDPVVGFNRNGEIVTSDGCGLLAANPVTGAKRTLVPGLSGCPYPSYYDVAWAPDGSRLAYRFDFFCGGCGSDRARQSRGDVGIWVFAPATGDLKQVARCETSECEYQDPSWSPDGSRIVFEHDTHIWVIDADGGNLTRLTDPTSPEAFSGPAWSPDGSQVAYVGNSSSGARVYTSHVNIPGGGARLIVFDGPGQIAEGPAWSPDSRRIAFSTHGAGDSILVVGEDGSNPTVALRGTSGRPREPSWSPDGTRIAYVAVRVGNAGAGAEVPETRIGEIWVMGSHGADPRRLYRSDCCAAMWSGPIWSPDGRYITFTQAQVDGTGAGAYVVAADGTGLRRVSDQPSGPESPYGVVAPPAWQPLRGD